MLAFGRGQLELLRGMCVAEIWQDGPGRRVKALRGSKTGFVH